MLLQKLNGANDPFSDAQKFPQQINLSDLDYDGYAQEMGLTDGKMKLDDFERMMRKQLKHYAQSRLSSMSEFWTITDKDFTTIGTLKHILMEQINIKDHLCSLTNGTSANSSRKMIGLGDGLDQRLAKLGQVMNCEDGNGLTAVDGYDELMSKTSDFLQQQRIELLQMINSMLPNRHDPNQARGRGKKKYDKLSTQSPKAHTLPHESLVTAENVDIDATIDTLSGRPKSAKGNMSVNSRRKSRSASPRRGPAKVQSSKAKPAAISGGDSEVFDAEGSPNYATVVSFHTKSDEIEPIPLEADIGEDEAVGRGEVGVSIGHYLGDDAVADNIAAGIKSLEGPSKSTKSRAASSAKQKRGQNKGGSEVDGADKGSDVHLRRGVDGFIGSTGTEEVLVSNHWQDIGTSKSLSVPDTPKDSAGESSAHSKKTKNSVTSAVDGVLSRKLSNSERKGEAEPSNIHANAQLAYAMTSEHVAPTPNRAESL